MSKQITIQQAREYYELGVISGFHVMREILEDGWNVCIEGTSGTLWYLHTARGVMRRFASLDSAVKAIEEVGFRVTSLRVGG